MSDRVTIRKLPSTTVIVRDEPRIPIDLVSEIPVNGKALAKSSRYVGFDSRRSGTKKIFGIPCRKPDLQSLSQASPGGRPECSLLCEHYISNAGSVAAAHNGNRGCRRAASTENDLASKGSE